MAWAVCSPCRASVKPLGGPRGGSGIISGMRNLSAVELAERAGVPLAEVDRLCELGILPQREDNEQFTEGDISRVRMAKTCEAAGLALEGIAAAIREGKLSFAFLDLPSFRWSPRSDRTYAELAAEMGLPLADVLSVPEAMGVARPRGEDLSREDDGDILMLFSAVKGMDIPMTRLLGNIRVSMESLLRIARAETTIYHEYFEMPLLRSGMGQRNMMEIAAQMGNTVVSLLDQVIMRIYRRAQEHVWTEDLIEHIEAALEDAGVRRSVDRPPAICFLDLSGYTRLTEERGDEAAAELAGRLGDFVQTTSHDHGGRPVKWLGDGVMFHFREPAGAVVAAMDMVEGAPQAGLPPAHVGIHAGPVIQREGDYFGRTVNLASRIASGAVAGEVLVTDEVVQTSGRMAKIRFIEVDPVNLKGVSKPVPLHRAVRD
jgi:adenylate cyclase